jgi:type III secretion system YscQ/HrcQ family protein
VSTDRIAPLEADAGPLGPLPRVSRREVRFGPWARRLAGSVRVRDAIVWLRDAAPELGAPEIVERASGLRRPGLIARFSCPGRSVSVGLGVETPLAHELVSRLLGFPRAPGEERLPLSPVEWGLLGFILTRLMAELFRDEPAPAWLLERVGPDPFVPDGPTITLRWPVRIGGTTGAVRLWLPVAVLEGVVEPPSPAIEQPAKYAGLGSSWRAVAGTVTLPRGLGRLRVGGVVPIDGSALRGTTASPAGAVVLELRERDAAWRLPAELQPFSSGGRVVVAGRPVREPIPHEGLPMSAADPSSPPSPAEVPVTLTIELGRVSLPLHRLADLKPGDVLELGRHAREPVELTSNGRLVARGELVQIDTELGVRVTNVLL